MGLKSFLKQQGFIEDGPEEKKEQPTQNPHVEQKAASSVAPTVFPVYPASTSAASRPPSAAAQSSEPSFVSPMQQNIADSQQPDPTFVKFFEDELAKANLPGLDYFEFRQMLIKTQQKMAAKGVVAPEVVLQAVLTVFEAQDIAPGKLVEAARHYKDVLVQKKDDFLKGAAAEKNNQLQKRQGVLQAHDDNLKKLQQQLQQLEAQKKQLEDAMNKERTQGDVDKSLGKEAIEKIEKAERLISAAHDYMQSTIDTDIRRLQNV